MMKAFVVIFALCPLVSVADNLMPMWPLLSWTQHPRDLSISNVDLESLIADILADPAGWTKCVVVGHCDAVNMNKKWAKLIGKMSSITNKFDWEKEKNSLFGPISMLKWALDFFKDETDSTKPTISGFIPFEVLRFVLLNRDQLMAYFKTSDEHGLKNFLISNQGKFIEKSRLPKNKEQKEQNLEDWEDRIEILKSHYHVFADQTYECGNWLKGKTCSVYE